MDSRVGTRRELPLAPDGRYGPGRDTELSALLSMFRSPDEEEAALLDELIHGN